MLSGTLNRRISVEYKSVESDTVYGTETILWRRLFTGWAQVQDALPSRSEAVRQGLEIGRDQVRIRMRYRSDITSDMRVVVHGDGDTLYQIVGGPAVLGRKDGLEIVCERYTS